MVTFDVRQAVLNDLRALASLEHEHFPAVAGQYHSGFIFDHAEMAEYFLSGAMPELGRFFIAVATIDEEVVGFASTRPSSFPGNGGLDPKNILLQYVAVSALHQRQGIARALLEHLETRIALLRQDVILAHIPTAQIGFYRKVGWEIIAERSGYAWLPFNDFLRADFPDPEIGFPHVAVKVLRPAAIRLSYVFPLDIGLPLPDACKVLALLLARGDIDARDLDQGTTTMLSMMKNMPA
jgi:ribosomal protein S18 acetylase RimI-like enzyme